MMNEQIVLLLTTQEHDTLVKMLENGQWTGSANVMEVLGGIYRKVKGGAIPLDQFVNKQERSNRSSIADLKDSTKNTQDK